jgi:hypothetical protein
MGQSTSQSLFEEIGEREEFSDDTVEQIDRLWKKYDKVGQGLMDQKVSYKFLGAIYVYLITRGDIHKKYCPIKKSEIVEKWFLYFDAGIFA